MANRINFVDFFKYFKPEIDEHIKALKLLEAKIPDEELQDSAEWVKVYRSHARQKHQAATESPRPSGVVYPVDWRDTNAKVSRYFTVVEVTKGDSRRVPESGSLIEQNILKLAKTLDSVREDWGAPIGVTSWYRPLPVNREVGSGDNSYHVKGLAADVYTMDGKDEEFEDWLHSFWQGGLGFGVASGKGFTHLDLGPYRRWDY